MRKEINIYALYKGEECLSDGTITQIAEDCGLRPNSVRAYGNRNYVQSILNNVKSRAKVLIKIEDMEIEF